MPLSEIPGRIFLDSSTLQTLQDFGEYIYDGEEISPNNKIWMIPDGINNVEALRNIMLVGSRGSLQLAISHNSIQEVLDRGKFDYLTWALEVVDYWESCIYSYEGNSNAFSRQGLLLSAKLQENQFGYLSIKDAKLISDAIILECEVFLTMERKLPRNYAHIERELGIKVLQPIGYWNLLEPWAALLG